MRATVEYLSVAKAETREAYGDLIDEIERKGMFYPVTVLDGFPLMDGSISYPRIRTAVDERLERLDALNA